MTKKFKRPTTFKYEFFNWKINYLNVECEDHGSCMVDTKSINIYIKDKTEEVIIDSVAHEINHLLFENMIPTVIQGSSNSEEMEENLVRFLTPRLVTLYRDNGELRKYIFGGK